MIWPFITRSACEQLVMSLIFSSLDYCNSLMFGIPASQIKQLQTIQNNVAWLILKKTKTRGSHAIAYGFALVASKGTN